MTINSSALNSSTLNSSALNSSTLASSPLTGAAPLDALRAIANTYRVRPDVALVGENSYSVLAPHETMGFVDKVGSVFVAYSGFDHRHAVEVGQSLSWDDAVAMVTRAFTLHSLPSTHRD